MYGNWCQDHAPQLARDEASKRLFLKGLEPVARVGEQLHNPDMAETLTLLAADPAGFYTNHLAHEFIEAAQAVNNVTGKRGLITAADMRAYRAVYREPVRYNFTTAKGQKLG